MAKTIRRRVFTFGELLKLEKRKKVTSAAVEKARTWLWEGATDHGWYDYTFEEWGKALASVGFDNAEINFTGFWCQGDGACFTARVDLRVLIPFLANPPEAREPLDYDGEEEIWPPWVVFKAKGVSGNPEFARLLAIVDHLDMGVERIWGGGNYSHEGMCRVMGELLSDGWTTTGGQRHRKFLWARRPTLDGVWDDFVKAAERLRYDLCKAIYKDLEAEHEHLTSDESLADASDANDWHFDRHGEWAR